MAWTAPMTAVATQVFTASAFNKDIRDNLNETAVAKATTSGSIFVTTAANSIEERFISSSEVTTSETTTSTSYANLATIGPWITVNTGSSAIVIFSASISNSTAAISSYASVIVTGATSINANDEWAIRNDGSLGGYGMRTMSVHRFTGLTPGDNAFTMLYKVDANTGTFFNRQITVIPI